jgi:hypothetical protein
VLARLIQVGQNVTGSTTQPFGGIHLLFMGDLCQKPPAFGTSLAQAVLQVHRHEQIRDLEIKRASVASNQAQPQQRIGIARRKGFKARKFQMIRTKKAYLTQLTPFELAVTSLQGQGG